MGGMNFQKRILLATISFVFIAVISFFCLAYLLSDAHIANRCGATLSALGALLVIAQVFVENSHNQIAVNENNTIQGDDLTPLNREQAEKVIANREAVRKHERLYVVYCIAIVVLVGELLHGWGDVVYILIFGVSH